MSFRHELVVRYAEVDAQQVVFNSHYLAWADDAMSHWMRSAGLPYGRDQWPFGTWDFMVRHAEVDWRGSAGFGDLVTIDCDVERWGETSFTVRYVVAVDEDPKVEIRLTYVGIDGTTQTKAPVPAGFRAALA